MSWLLIQPYQHFFWLTHECIFDPIQCSLIFYQLLLSPWHGESWSTVQSPHAGWPFVTTPHPAEVINLEQEGVSAFVSTCYFNTTMVGGPRFDKPILASVLSLPFGNCSLQPATTVPPPVNILCAYVAHCLSDFSICSCRQACLCSIGTTLYVWIRCKP